jgi:Berberine and berberine like
VNFAGEAGVDNVRRSYPAAVFAHLQTVKDHYDPSNMFRFNINIPPTK